MLRTSEGIMWGKLNLSTLQPILVGGLLAGLLVATLGGCSRDVRRLDYPVFNLADSPEPTRVTDPAAETVRPPYPQP